MKKQSINFEQWMQTFLAFRYLRSLLLFVSAVVLYGVMLSNIVPEKLDIKLFSVANKDIISPITVENKVATARKQQEAIEAVPSQYIFKKNYAESQSEQAKAAINTLIEESQKQQSQEMNDDELKRIRSQLPSPINDKLADETLRTLLEATPAQLEYMREMVPTTINEVMSEPIAVDHMKEAKNEMKIKLSSLAVNDRLQGAINDFALFFIRPNYLLDTETTKLKRQEAKESVNPVIIREGQVVVKEGQVITRDLYQQLDMIGLLEKKANPLPYLGLLLFVSLITLTIAYFTKDLPNKVRTQNTYFFMFVLLFLATILLMKGISVLQKLSELHAIAYLMPIAFSTMMIRMLINEKVAFISSVILSMCGSVIFNVGITGQFNPLMGMYLFFSALGGIVSLGKQNNRVKILQAGLIVAVINVVVLTMFTLLRSGHFSMREVIYIFGFAILGGFLSAVLTLGLLPVFETSFSLTSTMRLIELSNPNQPLLRKLLMEAPGTYHHSLMVANLAESACEAIGANGLLARVGSYYHDIGKTKRAHFFIENQMNMDNPHDKIAPQLSKTIIVAHPYDGRDMLKEARFPDEIIHIAEQHHGTTLLKYFYHKANQLSEQPIHESEFRYPGPKAKTKEAAIVGIADCVEAAVRSLAKPTPHKIELLVRNIIRDRLEDGQFDDCDLTLHELSKVAISLCETLQGIFHSRIEYPEEMKKKVKQG